VRIGRKRKTFMLAIGKPRRRIAIGHYPDLSLAKAREKARDLLAEARLRKDEPPSIRFEEALESFYRIHGADQRPVTRKECQRLLNKHFRPHLAHKQLADIKTTELAHLLDRIESPSSRRNSRSYLAAFFHWTFRRGYIEANPTSRLERGKAPESRDRVVSDEEIVRIWRACPEDDYGLIVRLALLTGQRIGQWVRFKPQYLMADEGLIVWPRETMKANKAHTIPLTPTVHDLIQRRSNVPPCRWPDDKSKNRLDKASGVTGWTHHDLRRTLATRLAEMGTAPHIIERLLAHSMPTIMGIYNRASYVREMREAMLLWETRLQTLLQSTEGTNGRGDIRNVRRA
jgi:integrase